MQGLHRPVRCLFRDRIVEPWGGILGVQFLSNTILALIQRYAFLFIVGLAQIAPDNGVIGVQARGNLDLSASLMQIALPDLGQPEPQPGEGIRLIQRNRFVKGLLGPCRLDLRQVGETQHCLCP